MECAAIDCDNERASYGKYCSNVCMNVQVEVAAEAAFHMDGIAAPEDVPDERVAEIREKNQRLHDEISAKIKANAPEGV